MSRCLWDDCQYKWKEKEKNIAAIFSWVTGIVLMKFWKQETFRQKFNKNYFLLYQKFEKFKV